MLTLVFNHPFGIASIATSIVMRGVFHATSKAAGSMWCAPHQSRIRETTLFGVLLLPELRLRLNDGWGVIQTSSVKWRWTPNRGVEIPVSSLGI